MEISQGYLLRESCDSINDIIYYCDCCFVYAMPTVSLELDNLVNYCLKLGKLEEAKTLADDAVRNLKENLPPDHPDIIRSKLLFHTLLDVVFTSKQMTLKHLFSIGIITLAKVYTELGQCQNAETELRKAWAMIESSFLTEHQVACCGK